MAEKGPFFLITCFCSAVYLGLTPKLLTSQLAPPSLDSLLAEASEYCERLKAAALDYVCEERIAEADYTLRKRSGVRPGGIRMDENPIRELLTVGRIDKKRLVYDYQMIKKGDDFHEARTLLEENGKKKNERGASLRTLKASTKFLVFGPVGFLSRYWQFFFDYELKGTDLVGESPAVVIRAAPKTPREENNSFGRIWLDRETAAVLKIEWEPRSLSEYTETVDSTVGPLHRKFTWTVTYDVEKNGLRFPGRQDVREVYFSAPGQEQVKYEATYVYSGYRFFTVETEGAVKKTPSEQSR